jgi:hypothetical protein
VTEEERRAHKTKKKNERKIKVLNEFVFTAAMMTTISRNIAVGLLCWRGEGRKIK